MEKCVEEVLRNSISDIPNQGDGYERCGHLFVKCFHNCNKDYSETTTRHH